MLVAVEAGLFHVSIECVFGTPRDDPFPCTDIAMRPGDLDRSVYATISDVYGNWAAPLRLAQWVSSDSSVVTVVVGDTGRAECLIRVVAPGAATVVLRDSTGAVRDSVQVVVEAPTAVLVNEPADEPPASDQPSDGCGCGAGTGVAFIPLVGLRIASAWRRRKKPGVGGTARRS
jgi:hypothetical protein